MLQRSKQGPARAAEVVEHGERLLAILGDPPSDPARAHTVHKLRTVAAHALWQAAEAAGEPSAGAHREATGAFARAWMGSAAATGKDPSTARATCALALGPARCEP